MDGDGSNDVLAVIPARGGSKGLPGKNLAPFLGRPLIAWSVSAARDAELITRTIVTTDDEQIAAVARESGAEVPFLRPAELAADDVLDLPVFLHALDWLERNEDYRPRTVVHLRPTSPIRPSGLIDRAVRLLGSDPDAHSVRGVCRPPCTPYKMWRIEQGRLQPLLTSSVPEHWNAPRQSLPDIYWQVGTIDVIRASTLTALGSMSGTEILPLVLDPALAADIDDQASLEWAERVALGAGLGREP